MAVNYHNMEREFQKAEYIIRIIAYLIDTVILASFTLAVNLLLIISSYIVTDTLFWGSAGYYFALMVLIVTIGCSAYNVIALRGFGGSVGKHLMGLEVVSMKSRELSMKQVLCREFLGRTICKLMFFTGFAMMFYNEDGYGLHDKLAGTMVVRKGEDLMELAAGRERLKKALGEQDDMERYNRIYNRGINAKLSGGGNIRGESQEKEVVEQPPMMMSPDMSQNMIQNHMQVEVNPYEMNYGYQEFIPVNPEVFTYQEALQNVVDEHSLMEECQQHLQFYN